VLDFDTLKNQLGDWCLGQQETIERLPPLEVTEEQLLEQQKECQAMLAALNTHSDSVQKLEKMASQFFRDTEVSAWDGRAWSFCELCGVQVLFACVLNHCIVSQSGNVHGSYV